MARGTEPRGDELDNEHKLRLLRELANALTRLGVGAQVIDGLALRVSTPNPGVHIRVSVEGPEWLFTWRESQEPAASQEHNSSHSVDDAEGAAAEIAKFANRHNGPANGRVRS